MSRGPRGSPIFQLAPGETRQEPFRRNAMKVKTQIKAGVVNGDSGGPMV